MKQAHAHLEGLRLRQAHLPDVIIVDLALPRLSGEEVVGALRAVSDLRGIPLLVLSGHIRTDVAQRLTSAGVSRVITEPKSYTEHLDLARSLDYFMASERRHQV